MTPTAKTLVVAGILLWLLWPEYEALAAAELPESDIIPTHGGDYQTHSYSSNITPTFECK